jgi:flap endonuclease-1
MKFIKLGITPVWIYDGQPSDLKFEETQRRKESKEYYLQQKQISLEDENYQRALQLSKRSVYITQSQINSSKALLKLSGFDYIESSNEADTLMVYLYNKGIVDHIITPDSDLIVYGLERSFKQNTKKGEEGFDEINLNQILEELDIDYDQFVDFCILCGSDYNSHAKLLGPSKAMKFIHKYKNIESILDSEVSQKYDLSCYNRFNEIRSLFKSIREERFEPNIIHSNNLSNQEILELSKEQNNVFKVTGELNENGLMEFYRSKNFKERRIEKIISDLSENK